MASAPPHALRKHGDTRSGTCLLIDASPLSVCIVCLHLCLFCSSLTLFLSHTSFPKGFLRRKRHLLTSHQVWTICLTPVNYCLFNAVKFCDVAGVALIVIHGSCDCFQYNKDIVLDKSRYIQPCSWHNDGANMLILSRYKGYHVHRHCVLAC